MEKISVPVWVPGMLTHCTENQREVNIEASTLQECMKILLKTYPLLKVHLFEENGVQREHVNLYINDHNTRWLQNRDIPLKNGDSLTILQAVSGG